MESQDIYSYDNSFHSGQDGDYACDSQDHYSDTGDSYDSSLVDDSELDDMLIILMTKRTFTQRYIQYLNKIYRYFYDGNK